MALVRIVRSRGQDDLAYAAIEADHGGDMSAWQLLKAARRTGAPRKLDHGADGFPLASHDAPPLMRVRSAPHPRMSSSRPKRGAALLGENVIGFGKLASAVRRAIKLSDAP
jgi:hypothetical protein